MLKTLRDSRIEHVFPIFPGSAGLKGGFHGVAYLSVSRGFTGGFYGLQYLSVSQGFKGDFSGDHKVERYSIKLRDHPFDDSLLL